jgi:hypothetical protein
LHTCGDTRTAEPRTDTWMWRAASAWRTASGARPGGRAMPNRLAARRRRAASRRPPGWHRPRKPPRRHGRGEPGDRGRSGCRRSSAPAPSPRALRSSALQAAPGQWPGPSPGTDSPPD